MVLLPDCRNFPLTKCLWLKSSVPDLTYELNPCRPWKLSWIFFFNLRDQSATLGCSHSLLDISDSFYLYLRSISLVRNTLILPTHMRDSFWYISNDLRNRYLVFEVSIFSDVHFVWNSSLWFHPDGYDLQFWHPTNLITIACNYNDLFNVQCPYWWHPTWYRSFLSI